MIPAHYYGNLTADPESQRVGDRLVVRFTLACDDEYRDKTGAWVKNPPLFVSVEAWDGVARGVKARLRRGSAAVVVGRWRAVEYEREGQKRRRQYVVAQAVGAALYEDKVREEPSSSGEVSSSQGGSEGAPAAETPAVQPVPQPAPSSAGQGADEPQAGAQPVVEEQASAAADDFWGAAR